MNVDSDKPRYIECIYEANITFDLEELDIDWDNVKDYYIKYGTLYIDFKDGSSEEYEGNQGETDWKWSAQENILTEDWSLVEGLNL